MRVGLCLAAAGLLLGGCAGSLPTFLAGGQPNNQATTAPPAAQVTSGTAPPATGRPSGSRTANDNPNCVTAWEQNAYHYQCDPNANY
jgi:hypothetical protein